MLCIQLLKLKPPMFPFLITNEQIRTSTDQSQSVGRCIKSKSSLSSIDDIPIFLLLISAVRAEYIMKPVHPHEYLNNYYIECLDEVTALCVVDTNSNGTVVVQDMSGHPYF